MCRSQPRRPSRSPQVSHSKTAAGSIACKTGRPCWSCTSPTSSWQPEMATGNRPSGNSMGVEILTPGATTGATTGTQANPPATPANDNGGLKAVGPVNATPLPAAEKPAEAPNAVNDVASKPQPAAQAPNANG